MRKAALPLALVFLDLFIRAVFAGNMSVSGDEAFSIFHSQMDIHTIITQLCRGNNPPLYEMILHYWVSWFGISEPAVRYLSVLFSSLTVLFIYFTGLRFFNFRIAIASSLMYTFSTFSIVLSHEARVYSFFGLLSAISMYAFFQLVRGRKPAIYFPALVLSYILLAYAHTLGLLVPLIQILGCLIFAELRRGKLLLICSALALSLIFYLPYFTVFLSRFQAVAHTGTWLRPVGIDQPYYILWSFSNAPLAVAVFIPALLLSMLKWMGSANRHLSIYTRILILWFIVPFLFIFLISLKYFPYNIPLLQDRYLIFILTAFYLLVAIAFDHISGKAALKPFIMALPVILMLATCRADPDNKMHMADAARKVRELKTGNTVVYLCPSYFSANFAYYYDRSYFGLYDTGTVYRRLDSCLARESVFAISDSSGIDTVLCDAAGRVIYLDISSDFLLPGNHVYEKLMARYTPENRYSFPAVYTVFVFRKNNE